MAWILRSVIVLYLQLIPFIAFGDVGIVDKLNSYFRAHERDIPADLLYRESFRRIPAQLLTELSVLKREDFLSLMSSKAEALRINKGVAANFLKIHQMTLLSSRHELMTEDGDAVSGLSMFEADLLTASFRDLQPEDRLDSDFNYVRHEQEHFHAPRALNNDWYFFKIAAAFFMNKGHEEMEITSAVYTRGVPRRAYMVSAGQEQVLSLLENLRFTEREIRFLSEHPQLANVSKEFFQYLKAWRFKGSVRMMPAGTVFYPNEPIMEITADPVDLHLVEALILPLMNSMTSAASKTARLVSVMYGRNLVEGGSRRTLEGNMKALAALFGGAIGTSNADVARITGTTPFGSMSHSWVQTSASNELEAHLKYLEVYPDSTLLVDTDDIMEGSKIAARAASKSLVGVRVDSTIAELSVGETNRRVRALLESLGQTEVKIGLSGKFNEDTLAELPPEVSPHDWALVGTEIVLPSDGGNLGMVMKPVLVRTGHVIRYTTKLSANKSGIPGRTQVYRFFEQNESGEEQQMSHDVIAEMTESVDGGRPLLIEAMKGGKRLQKSELHMTTVERAQKGRAQIPSRVANIKAETGVYPVQVSAKLQRIKRDLIESRTPLKEMNIGVVFGSFDGAHSAHRDIGLRARTLYNLQKVIYVPAGDDPVHRKVYRYPGEARIKMLEEKLAGHEGVSVDPIEVNGTTRYTIDTLRAISERFHGRAKLFAIVGEDTFKTLPAWNGAEELLGMASWIVAKRGPGKLGLEPRPGFRKIDDRHWEGPRGYVIELVDLNTGSISSTKLKEEWSQADTIFHFVDVQETFLEASGTRLDGALKVPGSMQRIPNVMRLARIARASNRVHAVLTKDFHYWSEVRNAALNGEFHAPYNFVPHGMANLTGPKGHEILRELMDLFPMELRLTIPHHYEVKGATQEEDRLELAEFDLDRYADLVHDPRIVKIVQKNGPASYDVFRNPRMGDLVQRIKPKKVYIAGFATDFCVRAACLGYLDVVKKYKALGYEVFVVQDAIAGIFPDKIRETMEELKNAGALFVTTDEVEKEYANDNQCGVVLQTGT